MRWQLASTLAALAMSGCYAPNTVPCPNGVLCAEGKACTGFNPGDGKDLCADEAAVAACAGLGSRELCMQGATAGLCIDNVCNECKPELFECRYDEWTSVASPVDTQLVGVFVAEMDRAYAVGGVGAVISYDGLGWTEGIDGLSTSINHAFASIWVSGDQVMVAGNVAIRTGQQVPTTPPKTVNAIWGDGIDDLVAVGEGELTGEYDGSDWTWDEPAIAVTSYEGVWGWPGENAVIAVARGKLAHRKNGAWTTTTPPFADALNGIWGVSENDFFVVGNQETTGSPGVLYHYTGTWGANEAPAGTPKLTAIWGASATEIYAVGEGGTTLHYDGTAWLPLEHRNGNLANLTHVSGIQAGGRTHVIAVGNAGEIWRYSP